MRTIRPKMNWKDKERVIEYAKELNEVLVEANAGDRVLVIQYNDRLNYNICHMSRRDLWSRDDVSVVWNEDMS